jgi:5-(carboxyamino)imidazole ribonucleotide mutase
MDESEPVVAIVMGSDSDLPVMQDAARILDDFAIPYELTIVSAHRTPARMVDFAQSAADRGLKVIIAGAGGAAHLPGMIASLTPLPVIGVPVTSRFLNGLDSLLSIAQMPPGIPVATVAVNGARNAGLLAASILGCHDPAIRQKLIDHKATLEREVTKKAERLESVGHRQYVNDMERKLTTERSR